MHSLCRIDGLVLYLSYILIAFFDVFCSTHNQLMNIVYLCFLSRRVRWSIGATYSKNTVHLSGRVDEIEVSSLVAGLSQQRSPAVERSPPPSPRFAWHEAYEISHDVVVCITYLSP